MSTELGATGARGSGWIAWSVCAVAGLSMLVWSWRTWPDVLVDFGGEIYVPWRLCEGEVLYRDVAYFTGPLSPYVDALWFRLFGTSFLTLASANVCILGLIAALLFHLAARIADRWSASAATVVFLTLFAFAQLEIYGNSNYVAPYSHETTHGTLIALSAVACLERWMSTGRKLWIAGLGLLVGLSFLTKVEYFLATAAACAVGIAGWLWSARADRRSVVRTLALALVCALAAPLVAFCALSTAMDAPQAWRGTTGAWQYVFDARITSLRFYKFVMGTDRPLENLRLLFQWSLPHAVFVGAALALALALRKRKSGTTIFGLAFVATALLLLTLQRTPRVWLEAFRPLPLFTALALAACFVRAVRLRGDQALAARTEPAFATRADRILAARADGALAARPILGASLCTFALVLIAKMVLNARLQGYGYALAMPATIVFALALTSWIPRAIEQRGGNAALFRGAAFGFLAAAIASHLSIMRGYLASKTIEVGRGSDAFLADGRGALVNSALAVLESRMEPDETLAVLPEGVMLNYLLRRKTAARYINYMPPELLMFGEDNMVADFAARPPDWIVLAHKPTSEYGFAYFGQDYGQRLFAWIGAHYEIDASFGDPPLQRGSRFGIRILRRKR